MEPLYLVDGSGYIFRAFYAVAPLSNSQGLPTNALVGFSRMLAKLIKDFKAKYIAVTFDTKEPTFRHLMYPQYKANRVECPHDLIPQLPYFRKIVQAFGILSLEKAGVEADDIIATIARNFSKQGQEVIVVSGDKDLLQLVDTNIKVFDAMRDRTFSEADVKEKMGVWPKQVRDYLALIGDSSDNVPGIKGLGPKTAEILFDKFETLENLLANIDTLESIPGIRGAKSIKEKLLNSQDILKISLDLVSLKEDVDPFYLFSDIEELKSKDIQQDLIQPLFEELEFTRFLSTLSLAPGAPKGENVIKKKYQLITKETLNDFVKTLSSQKEFAFDTETISLDVMATKLYGISFSWSALEAYFLPLMGEGALDEKTVFELLNPIFSNSEIKKIGQNLKFDMGVLSTQGYTVKGIHFDTMLAGHLLHPDKRQNGLKQLSKIYLNEEMTTYEQMMGENEDIASVPQEQVCNYACHDAEVTWKLYKTLDPLLGDKPATRPSLRFAYENTEVPLVPVLEKMQRNGIKLDLPFLDSLSEEFSKEIAELELQIYKLADSEFNINSPKQLSVILFEKLGLPTKGVKKNQTAYSTDAGVLQDLAKEHEIARNLLEYRELHKLNSTYVESLKKLVRPETSRVHTSYNQAIAATGRLSSTEPNLQNIPIKNARGRKIRRAFVAEDGYLLLSADYSQIELRILAHLSGDKNLQLAFINNEDIHQKTADELFGAQIASAQEKKELRRVAKTINFGVIYGISAFRLSNELGVSRRQAQDYIDQYFNRYPSVKEYFETIKTEIKSLGYVQTYFGRRRFLSEIETMGRDAGYAERSLINAPLQGTAAEIIKLAMIRLDGYLQTLKEDQARMLLQVHDELIFEVKEDFIEQFKTTVTSIMENSISLSIPLKVDLTCGKYWEK